MSELAFLISSMIGIIDKVSPTLTACIQINFPSGLFCDGMPNLSLTRSLSSSPFDILRKIYSLTMGPQKQLKNLIVVFGKALSEE